MNTINSRKNENDDNQIDWGKASVEALKRHTANIGNRNERYEEIYKIEQQNWPDTIRFKKRSEMTAEEESLLEDCIEKSQKVARDACQTEDLTQNYILQNTNI